MHWKHVFAGGDVDLTAAEIHRVDAVLDRCDDLARLAVARQHVGVGHARHRHMRVGFAPAVAGRLHVHQPRILAVLHVADEDAVLDQHGLVGRRAFVVDRQRAAPRLRWCRHPARSRPWRRPADPSARQRPRCLLRLKSPSRPCPTASCSITPGQPGAEHHIHFAGRRRHRFQIHQSLPDGIVDRAAPGLPSR